MVGIFSAITIQYLTGHAEYYRQSAKVTGEILNMVITNLTMTIRHNSYPINAI